MAKASSPTPKAAAKKSTPSAPTSVSGSYKPSATDKARERKYQCEDAVRTLTRAEEIRKDPILMRDVKKFATEQQAVLSKVVGKVK